jgi:hypothetical protein
MQKTPSSQPLCEQSAASNIIWWRGLSRLTDIDFGAIIRKKSWVIKGSPEDYISVDNGD